MSTFEERLRARVETLIAETMDDCASEVRKAITPKAETGPVHLSNYGVRTMCGQDAEHGQLTTWIPQDTSCQDCRKMYLRIQERISGRGLWWPR